MSTPSMTNTPGMKALKEYQRKLKSGEIQRKPLMNPIEKSKATPKSYKLRCYAKCYDCTCGDKKEITNCTCEDCPLWSVRPYQR